jgi:flagellin
MKSDNLGTKSEYTSKNAVGAVASLDFATTSATVKIGNTTVELKEDYSNNMEGLAAKLNDAFSQTEGVTVTAQGSNLIYKGASDFGTPTYADGGTGTGGGALLGTAAAAANATPGGALLSSLKDDALGGTIGLQTQSGADSAITAINHAIEKVSAERSKLGAYQNRLEHTINNLNTSSENLTAAESRVRDVDYALAA